MWLTSPEEQTALFFKAIFLGAAMAAVFDLMEGFRKALRLKKWGTAGLDLLFCMGALGAFLLFFLRCTDGRLRGYLFLGMFLGAVLEKKSLSKVLQRMMQQLCRGALWLLRQGKALLLWMFSFPRGQ